MLLEALTFDVGAKITALLNTALNSTFSVVESLFPAIVTASLIVVGIKVVQGVIKKTGNAVQ